LSRHARWILGGAGALAAAALLVPAAADWLVTRDGGRIETDGPWRVENRLVVFKQPDGTFASIRLSEVDLAASERVTREMAERAKAPAAPAPAPRQAVMRLTERDLPPVGSGGRGATAKGEPDAAAEGEATDDAGTRESLQVVSWREVSGPNSDGIEFVGNVRNITDRMALGVAVDVVLFDERGEETRSAGAVLTTLALPPGQAAGFRASFPGVYQYARAEFRTRGNLVLTDESARGSGAQGTESRDEEPPWTGR
jgi:hypothetical protein